MAATSTWLGMRHGVSGLAAEWWDMAKRQMFWGWSEASEASAEFPACNE